MIKPLPGLDVPVVNLQTGLMTQAWYEYFQLQAIFQKTLSKTVAFTRVLSTATGNQTVSGVGFPPRFVLFQTGINGGSGWSSSGQSDVVTNTSIEYQMAASAFFQPGMAGIQREDAAGTKYQSFVVASFDPDGFTLTWTKVGTPTATAQITAVCFR